MKLAERHNTVRSNGIMGESTQFNIEMNAKMFRVLSDTMYEDKIGSMVRELSCNAFDAHVEAGKRDVPFEIHLPSEIEPWFSVRDEGIGLSDDDIRKIYTSYGNSTKDASNEVIGAFGLGSKTPFAYTDQFTVTSIHDGMKRVYVAVINDNGMPTLSLQAEEPTTDHPGLEVLVSVDSSDFSRFADAVVDQLKFFKVKPTLANNLKRIEFGDINANVTVSNDLITMYGGHTNRTSLVNDLYVVQGGVGYRVRVENLRDHLTPQAIDLAQHLSRVGAYMEFPIGSIEVTASREGISYKPRTIDSIRNRLNEISKILTDEVFQRISDIETEWERAIEYNKLTNFEKILLANHQDFESLNERLRAMNRTAFISLENFATKGKPEYDFSVYEYQRKTGGRASGYSWDRERKDGVYNAQQARIVPEENMVVFVRDTTKAPVRRLRIFWEEQHSLRPMVVIETNRVGADGKLAVEDSFTDKVLKRLGKTLGGVEVRRISDLPLPPRASRKSSGERSTQPKAWVCNHSYDMSSRHWEPVYDLDDIDDGIFITMDRHQFIDLSENDYRMVIDAYKSGLIEGTIYSVNRKRAEKLKNDPEWTDISTIVKELKADIPKAQRVYDMVGRSEIMRNAFSGNNLIEQLVERREELTKGSLIHKLVFIRAISGRRNQKFRDMFVERFGHLGRHVTNNYTLTSWGPKSDGNLLDEKLNEMKDELFNTYPLLRNFSQYNRSIDELRALSDHVVMYVNMVDGG
jgi:hypothetical protein